MIALSINGKLYNFDGDQDTPLLWVIRDHAKLNGTKYGCGIGLCGVCTVHINGQAQRSCSVPAGRAAGADITTIEALNSPQALALKQFWSAIDVPQCGYCQPGQIMQAEALLRSNPAPTDADIEAVMSGNLCRCGTYAFIKDAIKAAARKVSA